ncbi:hypothetical protein [Leuconostoc citreum]|uniref:hypothetical protein n=1 Tax=Leuconostoc citreum TaxID=33964 RepID=UPI003B429ACC
MNKKRILGKNNKLKKLSIKELLLVTKKQFLTDWCVRISILIGALLLLINIFFGINVNISMSMLFGPSVTALSFSFAMMSAVKVLFPDEDLYEMAHAEYAENKVNGVYVLFSPFILGSIAWGIVAIASFVSTSINFSFIFGLWRNLFEILVFVVTLFSVLNLVQLMWIIVRLTIEKSFKNRN